MKQWLLPGIITIFGLISVATLKSVAPQLAAQQAVFFIIGLLIFFAALRVPFKQLLSLSWPMYGILCLLLLLSLAAGVLTHKTGRWIPVGFFNLQPSQLAIPIVALLLSKLQETMSFNTWQNLAKVALIIGIPAGLILIEPDLGTMLVYAIAVSTIVFMSDISWKKIGTIISIAIFTSIFSWFFILRDYQKLRVTSFMSGHSDSSGAGYNARQALIAAGSGRLWGRGLGQGVQSHLRFLPERQTDFIFASFAEEFGFGGAAVVLILYTLLIGNLFMTAHRTTSSAVRLYSTAIAVMTIIQAGINIGMNIGIMPITGITLPLLSYGGSSVLSLCAMFGVMQATANDISPKPALHLV